MKKNLYAVLDTASGIYDGPIPMQSDAFAVRAFSDQAVGDTPIGKHPEDFALIKVGIWNDGNGEIEDLQNMTLITGLEAIANARSADVVKNMADKLEAQISAGGTA